MIIYLLLYYLTPVLLTVRLDVFPHLSTFLITHNEACRIDNLYDILTL